jgi:DAK2 domain fusion protein YloV
MGESPQEARPLNDSASPPALVFPVDPTKPVLACDGQGFKRLLEASLQWVGQHTAVINSLNVFPVPDGDTGTNMYLTLQAACQEIEERPDRQVSSIAHYASRGALMGARGNSGVILSQIMRGLAQGVEGKEDFNSVEFAQALQLGAKVAYQAVIKPVEGTILTVIRELSDEAVQVAPQLTDLRELMTYIVHTAQESVARTPSLLPVLREAGVVDAGGQGLFVMLEGMARYLQGQTLLGDHAMSEAVDLQAMEVEEGYGYDIQYVIEGADLDVDQIRVDIAAMGDCPLVVGDSSTVKVHVHTPTPGDPLNYGAQVGSLSRVIVENMQEQYQEFIMGQASPILPEGEKELDIATIVVSPGPGLSKLFQSLGGSVIVPGGQTMNPSIEQLLQAIEDANAQEVLVLPNNSNIILAAEQAQALSNKRVRVIHTKTVPQGVSALLAYNYSANLETNARSMERSAEEVRTGEVTTAVRDVRVNSLEVKEGQIIGLVDGDLVVAGRNLDAVALEVLQHMGADEAEILTLYCGETVSEESAQTFAERIEAIYPYAEVEVVDGGQPHYHYIISAE